MCAMIEKLRMCCMEVIALGFRPIQNKGAPRSAPCPQLAFSASVALSALSCLRAAFCWLLRRNSLNFSRFRTSARICAAIGKKGGDHGGVDPVTTELTFPDQQDRDAFAPLLFEHSIGVDVELIDPPSKSGRKGRQRVPHVIAQVAVG